jgi:hypothetical protein
VIVGARALAMSRGVPGARGRSGGDEPDDRQEGGEDRRSLHGKPKLSLYALVRNFAIWARRRSTRP